MMRIMVRMDGHCRLQGHACSVVGTWRCMSGSEECTWRAQLGKTPASAEEWYSKSMFRHQRVDMVAHSAQQCSWRKGG